MGSKMGFKTTIKPKYKKATTKVENVFGIKITDGKNGAPKFKVTRTRKVIKNV